jgi:predicted ArsR family transcriptional regulator
MHFANMNGSVIDRKPVGRPKTRFTAADRREALLQRAFAEISESSPEQLRRVIERCDLFLRIARMRKDMALEQHARAIGLRALRRLKALKRRAASAISPPDFFQSRPRSFS